ncbi:uncharacterized protein ATC70_000686 [Mucor velutinosus]|uniref:Uncharacterized protein n=1 Tax=Mucor velutinosus TaxID=708070 RepID=A0AAN7DH24_9FUNG|nr:hypothetical protein ATC70_000686 [Mucor velutinosus]
MSTSFYQPVVKRSKSFGFSPQRLMDSFLQAMREIIENKARPIIDKPSKLDALKKTLLSVKKFPLGVMTTSEKICQCAKDELKNHLEHLPQATTSTFTGESASIPVIPVIAPSDSVAFLRRDLSGMDMVSDMSSVSGAPSRAAMSSISHNPFDKSMVEAPQDNDVPSDLVESFLQKLNTALHDVSDYVMDLQLVVYTLMLSMKSSQLVTRSGNIQLKKAHGFQTQDILPAGYNMKTNVTTFAPPFPSNALKSTAFCNGVKDFFQSRHIDYLHTALFGQELLEILLRVHLAPKRESHYWELQQTKAKKQSKQVVKSIRNSFHNTIRSEKYKLQRYQRKAQGKPEDNNWAKLARNSQERITHMYADAKRPVKSVSTSGTTSDQAAVSASGSGSFTTGVSIPTAPSGTSDAVTASNASFDLDSADMPIDELLPISELIDEKDDQEEEEGTRDLPRRRIMILKATPRNLLARQAGKSITHTQLKKERPDITEEENRVCMLLGNLLLPYIPTRDHYSYIGFQLPFCLALPLSVFWGHFILHPLSFYIYLNTFYEFI